MKTDELLINRQRVTAKIARQLVDSAIKDFVSEDVEKAVERSIDRFAKELKVNAMQHLRFMRMAKV